MEGNTAGVSSGQSKAVIDGWSVKRKATQHQYGREAQQHGKKHSSIRMTRICQTEGNTTVWKESTAVWKERQQYQDDDNLSREGNTVWKEESTASMEINRAVSQGCLLKSIRGSDRWVICQTEGNKHDRQGKHSSLKGNTAVSRVSSSQLLESS